MLIFLLNTSKLKKISFFLIYLFATNLVVPQNNNSTYDFESFISLTETLVKIQKEDYTLKSNWNNNKKFIEENINLLLKKKDILKKDIEDLKNNNILINEKIETSENKLKELKSINQKIYNLINNIISEIEKTKEILPQPFKKEFNNKINNSEKSNDIFFLLKKMLMLINYFKDLNEKLHLKTEIHNFKELGEKEVKVLYLGLNFGYFLGPKDLCGYLYPCNNQWKWEFKPSIKRKIKTLINNFTNSKHLPILKLPYIKQECV